MPRGGARPNSGPKPKFKPIDVRDRQFAARVLERIGKKDWRITDLALVTSDEDYAIYLISGPQGGHYFEKLVEKRDGRAPQSIQLDGKLDIDSAARRERIRQLLDRLAGKAKQ